ncbi:MAG: hypothetical protein AMS16_06420 [Planctomycetes bacterium DG_58]|nr:MAG: hypothetical protein AMS16_06420 [Planctomycetes bacterium DG_58]
MAEKLLVDLADEVNELASSAEMERRKPLWVKLFRGERPEKPPVKCCPFMAGHYDLVWRRLIPQESLHFRNGLARHLEIQLRKKIYKFRYMRDDDVIRPTVWVFAKEVTPRDDLWGLKIRRRRPEEEGGAYKELPPIREDADLDRLILPHFQQDDKADAATLQEARDLVDGRVPVKLYTRQIGYSPYEYAVLLRGAEPLLFDLYDRPAFVHRLMSLLADGIIQVETERETANAFDVEETTLLHQPWDEFPPGKEHLLSSAWAYLSAQSAAPLGPGMYAEFVQPYNARIAELFRKVYYHGCEDLGEKVNSIRELPKLRHFHVSPWTDLREVVPALRGRNVALEVHAHPTNVLFVWGPDGIRAEARRRMDQTEELPFDYVLCDLQTIEGADGKLEMWCDICMEESLR